jgi:hypothetical protein
MASSQGSDIAPYRFERAALRNNVCALHKFDAVFVRCAMRFAMMPGDRMRPFVIPQKPVISQRARSKASEIVIWFQAQP